MSATPIFDLEQPPPPGRPSRYWLYLLIGVLIGLLLVAVRLWIDNSDAADWDWPAFSGLLFLPALYVSTVVHEFGHLIVGRLVGLNPGGIAVGGLVLMKSGNNWIVHFDRHAWLGGFFKPLAKTSEFGAARYAWMIAGGPLASIVFAVLCVAGAQWDGPWHWNGTLLWTSLLLAVASLIPFSSGLNKSDTERLWLFIRRPEQVGFWMAALALQTEEAKGVRPREWSPQVIGQLLMADGSAREYPYCQLMAFYRRLDEQSEDAAIEHLENALARSAHAGDAMRYQLFLEAASASAEIRKQTSQARCWIERARKIRKPPPLNAIEAGIAMCEGRYAEAADHWRAARDHIARKRLDSGLARFAREKWAEQEAACRAMARSPEHLTKRMV